MFVSVCRFKDKRHTVPKTFYFTFLRSLTTPSTCVYRSQFCALLSARVYRLQTAQYALGNRSVFVHRSGLIHSAIAFRNFEAEKTI